jgi:hypothetical protein
VGQDQQDTILRCQLFNEHEHSLGGGAACEYWR